MAEYNVDPNDRFQRAIKKAIADVSDLTIPFQLMTREWFKANRSIFDRGRKSRGKYEDLKPKYKKVKQRRWGFIYPILVASGKLSDSMTEADNSDSVNTIINKQTLVLGTKVTSEKGAPYASFLHFGTEFMPPRPHVLVGGEQVATREINQRRENWIEMLADYVQQVSKGFAT